MCPREQWYRHRRCASVPAPQDVAAGVASRSVFTPPPASAPVSARVRLHDHASALIGRPWPFIGFAAALTTAGLALDAVSGYGGQLALSVVTWAVLVAVCVPLTGLERAQVAVVIAVATVAEVIGSILWGVYAYRLGNLPVFVPAGHGLVYLVGLRFAQTTLARVHPRRVVAVAAGMAGAWALIGLTGILGRYDVAGAVGTAVLIVFLIVGRAPCLYAGVFFFVAFLEIWGTAVGTWRWDEHVPGLGVMNGNPPSGAAAGYVLFDIAALALAPLLVRGWRRLASGPRDRDAGPAQVVTEVRG